MTINKSRRHAASTRGTSCSLRNPSPDRLDQPPPGGILGPQAVVPRVLDLNQPSTSRASDLASILNRAHLIALAVNDQEWNARLRQRFGVHRTIEHTGRQPAAEFKIDAAKRDRKIDPPREAQNRMNSRGGSPRQAIRSLGNDA